MATVTVGIPTIPQRKELLTEAVLSVAQQRRLPDNGIIEVDSNFTGAACTRNRILAQVDTDYVAWLDDDDFMLPNHIAALMHVAEREPEQDVIYPTPRIIGMRDPTAVVVDGKWRRPWGREWSEDHRQHMIQRGNFIPHTCLIKTEAMRDVDGYPEPGDSFYKISTCEDWGLFRRMALKGKRFRHINAVTWIWKKHDAHTGGQPDRARGVGA